MRAKLTGTVLKGIVASKIKISPFDSKEKKEQVSHNVSIERSHKSKEEKKEKKEKEREREKEKEKEKKEAKKLKKNNICPSTPINANTDIISFKSII